MLECVSIQCSVGLLFDIQKELTAEYAEGRREYHLNPLRTSVFSAVRIS